MDDLEAILKLEQEYRFFEENILFIGKRYGRSTYVAILGNEIIDSNKDEFKLVKRINKRYPDQPVLITRVEDYRKVVELSSPEIVR